MAELVNKNTPEGKGIRTAVQAIGGALVTYVVGLFAIPEVKAYTTTFVQTEGVTLLLVVLGLLGVGAGVVAFVQNWLENRSK